MYIDLKENRPHGTKEYPFTLYHISNPYRAYQIPIHWHDEVEIIYVRKGKLSVMIEGQEYTGHENSIFIVNAGQLHMMGTSDLHVDYFTLLFPLEFISFQTEDLLEKELLAPLRRRSLAFESVIKADYSDMTNILEQLIMINEKENEVDKVVNIINTRLLILELIKLLVNEKYLRETTNGKNQNVQKEIITYLQQNYCKHITLKELAEQFHFSEKYISRYFKEHFRLNVFQYVNYLRIQHAKHLLETTTLSVTDIALQSGFANVSYFIRTFKKSFGISPLQYRRQ